MVYGRKYNKRNFAKKKTNAARLKAATNRPPKKVDDFQNKTIESMDKRLKQLELEPEVKFVDEFTPNATFTTIGNWTVPLSPRPVLGTGDNERIGDEIFVTSWHLKGKISANGTVLLPTTVRMLVLIDKHYPQSSPSLTVGNSSVLDTTVISDPTLAPYRMETRDRYKILLDRVWTLTPQVVASASLTPTLQTTTQVLTREKYFSEFVRVRKRIKFLANGGNLNDLQGPQPLMVICSDLTGTLSQLEFAGRIYYKDI